MFTFLTKNPIQAFYTSAPSLSCQITLFPITYQNKIDSRFPLESVSEWDSVDIIVIVFCQKALFVTIWLSCAFWLSLHVSVKRRRTWIELSAWFCPPKHDRQSCQKHPEGRCVHDCTVAIGERSINDLASLAFGSVPKWRSSAHDSRRFDPSFGKEAMRHSAA
jgi:hypothetical protein